MTLVIASDFIFDLVSRIATAFVETSLLTTPFHPRPRARSPRPSNLYNFLPVLILKHLSPIQSLVHTNTNVLCFECHSKPHTEVRSQRALNTLVYTILM